MTEMHKPLPILGGLTAFEFMRDYWQKKPLLVKGAMPQIVGLLEPDELIDLATGSCFDDEDAHEHDDSCGHHLEDNENGLDSDDYDSQDAADGADSDQDYHGVTARLLSQHGKNNSEWQVQNSPISVDDLEKLPELWTLLVQAVDHWSEDVADLWQQFNFIPQWRREDVMVSLAPKGGSVGKHFDFYDVFLVQGYGKRRWQLGQMCDTNSPIEANQPLKLLSQLDVNFDEVLEAGDLLYIPPRLAHYGVAEDTCLTFSFGFRMPSMAQLIDRVSDQHLSNECAELSTPLADNLVRDSAAAGQVTEQDLDYLHAKLQALLADKNAFAQAAMKLLSEAKYPELLLEQQHLDEDELADFLKDGGGIRREPSVRLLYVENADGTQFWCNGDVIDLEDIGNTKLIKRFADGAVLYAGDIHKHAYSELVGLIESGVLILHAVDA